MTLLIHVNYFLALFALTCVQITVACNSQTGLCFRQQFDESTQTSFGFALPQGSTAKSNSFMEDFLANITTPLPYGFCGFISDEQDLGIALFMLVLPDPRPSKHHSKMTLPIVQYSMRSGDGKSFIPREGAVISISPLSSWTSDHATFIFRCQNCSMIQPGEGSSSAGYITVGAFWSNVLPEFPSEFALNATLPLTNLTTGSLSFEIAAIRVANYNSLLAAAGFA